MKILFLVSNFPNKFELSSGVFNFERVIALRKQGHVVKVISPIGLTPNLKLFLWKTKYKKIKNFFKDRFAHPAKLNIRNIEIFYFKWFWLPRKLFPLSQLYIFNFFINNRIFSIIENYKPELIIISWLFPYGAYAKYLKRSFDIPIILISEGSDILYIEKNVRLKALANKIFKHCVKMIITPSNYMKEKIDKSFPEIANIIVPNGYNGDNFFYDESSFRKINNNIINIISVGSLTYTKGHDIILNCFMNLSNNYHLTIIGYGELYDEYTDFINTNDLGDRVVMLGQILNNNIKHYFNKSDLFCLPSRSESFGISALEAMACGLPVIGSNVGGLVEIIHEDFNGFLFEAESVESLSAAIIRASQKQWDRKKIANWVKNKFSWDSWALNIISNYEKFS